MKTRRVRLPYTYNGVVAHTVRKDTLRVKEFSKSFRVQIRAHAQVTKIFSGNQVVVDGWKDIQIIAKPERSPAGYDPDILRQSAIKAMERRWLEGRDMMDHLKDVFDSRPVRKVSTPDSIWINAMHDVEAIRYAGLRFGYGVMAQSDYRGARGVSKFAALGAPY